CRRLCAHRNFTSTIPDHISAPPLPHGTSTARQLSCQRYTRRSLELHKHHSALGLATSLRPVQPVTLLRPHAAARAARFFVEKFQGRSMYAVRSEERRVGK